MWRWSECLDVPLLPGRQQPAMGVQLTLPNRLQPFLASQDALEVMSVTQSRNHCTEDTERDLTDVTLVSEDTYLGLDLCDC